LKRSFSVVSRQLYVIQKLQKKLSRASPNPTRTNNNNNNNNKNPNKHNNLPGTLSRVHHKRQEHIKQHDARHEQRVNGLQEVSVKHQLTDRQDTVQQMDGVVVPAAQGRGWGAGAEQGPEDDGYDDMEGDHGAVQEPVQVTEPAAGLAVDPVAALGGRLAQVADGPEGCALESYMRGTN
jgi:hypothetical protein